MLQVLQFYMSQPEFISLSEKALDNFVKILILLKLEVLNKF